MAGATSIGFLTFTEFLLTLVEAIVVLIGLQDLIIDVNKLSAIPFVILANVLAERGAIRKISAHFLNSLCKIKLSNGFLGFLDEDTLLVEIVVVAMLCSL